MSALKKIRFYVNAAVVILSAILAALSTIVPEDLSVVGSDDPATLGGGFWGMLILSLLTGGYNALVDWLKHRDKNDPFNITAG